MNKAVAILRLMRPANILTAVSDILAGCAIALYATNTPWRETATTSLLFLVAATAGLYGGGVVLNDVFDAELDKKERPERPIPSGKISKRAAALVGSILLVAGIMAAVLAHPSTYFSSSFFIAFCIAVAAVIYDKWGKHLPVAGPLNMGLCRGLNLLLGMSIAPFALIEYWVVGIVPVIYIAAITMISRGEVHGGNKSTLNGAVVLYVLVTGVILYIAIINRTLLNALLFLVVFSFMIFMPLRNAIRDPRGPLIGKAVKAGVIALILMNAAWAAAFGSLGFAFFILLLLPLSLLLAKVFMVT